MDPDQTVGGRPAGRSAEGRASIAFKLLAAFVAVILVATGGSTPDTDFPLLRWATIAYALAIIAVDLIAAIGLDIGARWALAAMRPILWLQLIAGGIGSITTLSHGSVPIPFDLVLLIWALRGPAGDRPTPPLDLRAGALIGTMLVLVANGTWLRPLFGAGGAFDAAEGDLLSAITVQCGPAGGGSPETVIVTYHWSWVRTGPPTGGSDVAIITWDGQDDADSQLYILGDAPDSGAGVSAGSETGVATGDANVFARSHYGSWQWGVDLGQQRYGPGQITVILRRAAGHSATGVLLTVEGAYAHSGAWRSTPALTSCEW
jgi:hypothetical protein